MIDRVTVERILEAANIVDVVSDFVTLKRSGVNLKGLCPFHDDRTPSFVVSPAKNFCKCFACGEGGSPVGFIMKHEHLSYPDALKYLARKYGIEVHERELTPEESRHNNHRESMFILNEYARDWFKNQLHNTVDGRSLGLAYFRDRGFQDDIIEKFQLGFCPSDGSAMSEDALASGYQEQYLLNEINDQDPSNSVGTGLSLKNDNGKLRDRFRGRVIWPIFTMSGRVAGFGGRVLDSATKGVNVKYLNSPESIIYSKRKELFGLYQARDAIRKQDLCYLVEGYTDVMAMHQHGVPNVVASSGTALTTRQIQLIHRITNNLTVIFDGDEAGVRAAERGIDMILAEGMNVKLLLLPNGEDPDSFGRTRSASEYQQYLEENQVDFIQYKISHLMKEAEDDPNKMSQLIHNVAESIGMIPDEITRVLYVRQASQMLNMEERLIREQVDQQIIDLREERRKQEERILRMQALERQKEEESLSSDSQDEASSSELPLSQDTSEEQTTQSAQQRDGRSDTNPLENDLIRLVIRYGGSKRFEMDDEDGQTVALTVAQFVSLLMLNQGIEFSHPLYTQILEEAKSHSEDEDFDSVKYFTHHVNPSINALAYHLCVDEIPLTERYADLTEEARLTDILPRLVYKIHLEKVDQEINRLVERSKLPSVMNDKAELADIFKKSIALKKLAKQLAKEAGVVTLKKSL